MGSAIIVERLIKAREWNGYNRKYFAEMLGIPYRTITNYENGSREPGSEYLLKVADVCGCTTDWLLGLTDNPRNDSPYSNLVRQETDSMFEALKKHYESMNAEGREKLLEYANDLVLSGRYEKNMLSGALQEEA